MINHPQFGTRCEICFRLLTVEDCAEDTDGQKWDICKGGCARQAGIIEQPRCQERGCPSFGDPDFGEATCPEDHALPR